MLVGHLCVSRHHNRRQGRVEPAAPLPVGSWLDDLDNLDGLDCSRVEVDALLEDPAQAAAIQRDNPALLDD
jgi:hypothetical protein